MQGPLISIIIPVYNAEKYLEKCIESIITQDYKNYEVILVNDGSKDRSLEICLNYAKKYEQIRSFSQLNQGQAKARNLGIAKANGEFLMFVDSDDYVEQNFCSVAIKTQKKYNSDIVIFDFKRITSNSEKIIRHFKDEGGVIEKEEAMEYIVNNSYVWNKLYRRSLFDNINFPAGKYYEDVFVSYKLIEEAKNISYVKKVTYTYKETGESTVSRKNSNFISDQFEAVDELFMFLKENYPMVYESSVSDLLIKSLRYCTFCPPDYNPELFDHAKHILLTTPIPKLISFKYKFTILLFKISPKVALQIFKIQKFRKRQEIK